MLIERLIERVLRHTSDRWYGRPFHLLDWQRAAVRALFDASGLPARSIGYIEVPKKNGKTELCAALAVAQLAAAPIRGCHIYLAAAGLRQAEHLYRAAASMVEQSPALYRHLRVLRSTWRILRRDDPDSFIRAIAADGDLTDGVNPYLVVADEMHRWRTRKMTQNWEVLRRGMIARDRALAIIITTAGARRDSALAWRLHERASLIARGAVDDPVWYAQIHTAPDGADWHDPATWIAANPSIDARGGFLRLETIRQIYHSALGSAIDEAAFRRYHLNIWEDAHAGAIDMADWERSRGDWEAAGWPAIRSTDLLRRWVDRPCWAGLDVSMTTDLTALVLLFPAANGAYDVLPFFWLPADRIEQRELRDGVPYRDWARDGWIELTDGAEIDLRAVRQRIDWAASMFDLREVCVDPYNAMELAAQLVDDGYLVVKVRQRYSELSAPTKRVLGLIRSGRLHHGGHPVLRWNAACLSVKSDGNDLIRPIKPDRINESGRIDGMTALITAMARAIAAEDTTARVTAI